MLDAAEDDHPLVQAVAQYALLHAGETEPGGDAGRPLPPLLDADGRHFSFRSSGGCNARIGPLTLVQAPPFANVQLSLDIEQVGFDLFRAPAKFTLVHTPPTLLAAALFAAHEG